ncbi:MAG TPA: HoxN/HupN/NixA family nickel/cobalt transporter [Candidatus Nanopelagicales bacterium]|nr:HoxN/HupN/NixA family nickel/cobalt transporter [Candidatus Nanopelagicales bacterium]
MTAQPMLTPAEQALVDEALPTRRLDLSRRDWWVLGGMAAFVLFLNVLGWGTLIGIVAPQNLAIGTSGIFGIGLGVTAFTLGMRHAFDADHIAAIDNTTRKLITDGQKPVSVGFWFSLGHSSIVFGLCFLLSLGVKSLVGQVEDGGSQLQQTLGLIGTSVSGTFLILIGVINLIVLMKIWRVFRGMREGDFDEVELEHHLSQRGFMNRLLGGVTKAVRKPRHMYPVGLLFGLGFDTATEVSLLVLAGGAAALSLPWYAILCLPVLFAAGMSLLDSIDGVFMVYAYGWAFSQPVRKIYYNIVITGLSVAVALVIGVVEILSIFVEKLDIQSGPLYAIGSLDLNNVGFVIVGLFVLTWLVAVVVWHVGKIEHKWSQNLKPVRPAFGSEQASSDDLPTLPETAHVHADGSLHDDGHAHAGSADARRNEPEADPV